MPADGGEGRFAKLVAVELERARSKHANLHTVHEGYAVILEEVEEFWAMVMLKAELRRKDLMLKELVQIAAMAERTAEDVGLLDD